MLEIKQWLTGDRTVPAISGRELHKALSPGRDFSTFISAKIESFGYIEGIDFGCFLTERGSKVQKEYLLSLTMASELCLLDRSEIGHKLRRFILEQQSLQKCACSGESCNDHKPMWELTAKEVEALAQPENEWIQCLIEREGDTTMAIPRTLGTVVTFKRNEHGHAVAKIPGKAHREAILKSIFYRQYANPNEIKKRPAGLSGKPEPNQCSLQPFTGRLLSTRGKGAVQSNP